MINTIEKPPIRDVPPSGQLILSPRWEKYFFTTYDEVNSSYVHRHDENNPHKTSDVNLVFNDVTTNNVSTTKHGFAPKAPGDSTYFLDGTGAWDVVRDSDLTLSDITTNNVTIAKHGFAPKAPNDGTKFLDGLGAWDTVKDSDLSLTDITTNDVSITKHGFVPKAPNDTSKFLRGDATWAAIAKVRYAPASITLTTGTYVAGNVASVATAFDGDFYHVDEVVGAPGFDISFNFTGVVDFNRINLKLAYDGAATHYVKVRLYNYVTPGYDDVSVFVTTGGYYAWYSFEGIPSVKYISAGAAVVNIYHITAGNASHDIKFEYVSLVDDGDD